MKVEYLKEVQCSNIKYSDIKKSASSYLIELNNDLTIEESSWNIILREADNYQNIVRQVKKIVKIGIKNKDEKIRQKYEWLKSYIHEKEESMREFKND